MKSKRVQGPGGRQQVLPDTCVWMCVHFCQRDYFYLFLVSLIREVDTLWASYTVRYIWHILTRYAHIKTHTIKICICTCMIFGYNCTGLETVSKFSWEVKEKARQRKRLWKQDQEEESETLRKREKKRYGYTFIILCFLFWLFFKGWFEMGTLLHSDT